MSFDIPYIPTYLRYFLVVVDLLHDDCGCLDGSHPYHSHLYHANVSWWMNDVQYRHCHHREQQLLSLSLLDAVVRRGCDESLLPVSCHSHHCLHPALRSVDSFGG